MKRAGWSPGMKRNQFVWFVILIKARTISSLADVPAMMFSRKIDKNVVLSVPRQCGRNPAAKKSYWPNLLCMTCIKSLQECIVRWHIVNTTNDGP